MSQDAFARERIIEVERTIRPHVRRTPVVEANGADFGLASFPLTFKLELLQHAGVFKTRGAFTHLLTRKVPPVGVAAASGGNHGAAVAYASQKLGVPAKIFVPSISSPAKINRIRGYGADLVVGGDRYDDARAACEAWVATSGAMTVHPFDQIETLQGQATLGLELEQQAPEVQTVLVAVGGGGLIGGLYVWAAGAPAGSAAARTKIVGVEPEGAPTLSKALEAGRPVDAEAGSIAADSLAPKRVGELMFPLAESHGQGVRLVSDDAIRQSQRALCDVLRVVVEPGGAAAFASLLSGRYRPAPGEHVAVIVSGGNTTAVDFDR